MKALPHIDHFQPVPDLAQGIVKVAVFTVIDVFFLERSDETLDQAILGGAGFVGHADLVAMFPQAVGVEAVGEVLYRPVAVNELYKRAEFRDVCVEGDS